MKLLHLAVATSTALCLSNTWAAQMSASVTMSNIHYQLTDLAPNDGIAPSLTFLFPDPTFSNAITSTGDFSTTPNPFDYHNLSGSSTFAPISATSALGSMAAHASVSGDGTLGGAVLHADGTFDPQKPTAVIALAGVMNSETAFSVTPHTRVTFLADAVVSPFLPNDCCTAFAQLGLQQSFLNFSASSSLEADGTLQVVADNTTGLARTFTGAAEVGIYGYTGPAPVPEPSTYAMLLAGLAGIGWVARRRRG